jgi:hypothetical protein
MDLVFHKKLLEESTVNRLVLTKFTVEQIISISKISIFVFTHHAPAFCDKKSLNSLIIAACRVVKKGLIQTLGYYTQIWARVNAFLLLGDRHKLFLTFALKELFCFSTCGTLWLKFSEHS